MSKPIFLNKRSAVKVNFQQTLQQEAFLISLKSSKIVFCRGSAPYPGYPSHSHSLDAFGASNSASSVRRSPCAPPETIVPYLLDSGAGADTPVMSTHSLKSTMVIISCCCFGQHYTTSGHNFSALTSAPVNICILLFTAATRPTERQVSSSTSNVISPMSSPTSTVSSTTTVQSDSHHSASGIIQESLLNLRSDNLCDVVNKTLLPVA